MSNNNFPHVLSIDRVIRTMSQYDIRLVHILGGTCKFLRQLLGRIIVWQILAKLYLSKQYFVENTCWCKTKYLNVVNHFNGSYLDIGDNGMLCETRFKSMPIYIFKTSVVCLRKMAVFARCT